MNIFIGKILYYESGSKGFESTQLLGILRKSFEMGPGSESGSKPWDCTQLLEL